MKSFVLIVVAFFFCLLSLDAQSPPQVEKNPPPLDPKNMDTSVKPQDDFFMYADGGWIKRTEIPPEYSRWGGFNELIERNNDALHVIAEKAADTHVDPRLAPEVQKVGDYYASGMDEKTIEAVSIKPLEEEFKNIDATKNRNDLLKEIAHLHTIGVDALFDLRLARIPRTVRTTSLRQFKADLVCPIGITIQRRMKPQRNCATNMSIMSRKC